MSGLPTYRLKRHLIGFEAHFDWSLAVVWSWPEEVLRALLSPGLTLDTYEGNAFIALALVKTREMRPAGLPRAAGFSFFLAGLRLFTRYETPQGRNLRGLKILGGGANSRVMKVLGDIMTHYRYQLVEAQIAEGADALSVQVKGGFDLDLTAETTPQEHPPVGSVFPDLRTARRFAGPMPFTFDYEEQTHSIIRVEGVRTQWSPAPVKVELAGNSLLPPDGFNEIGQGRLANAFLVKGVDYRWKRGVVEQLPRGE